MRVIGVYASEMRARQAADVARQAGAADDEIRVDESVDHVVEAEAAMRDEMDHALTVFTKEMTKGSMLGIVGGGVLGALFALPFATITFGDFDAWVRVVIVVACGSVVGSTAGWVIGGAFAARRPEEKLATERGVTLTAPASPAVVQALVETDPIRLDVVDDHDQPIRTLITEDANTRGVIDDIIKHGREEERRG